MRLRSLQLVLTDDCNFSCRYCYRRKGPIHMSPAVARGAVRRLLPRMGRDFGLFFYGGEPLLRFSVMREIVPEVRALARAAGKQPRFGLTTNGSLIDDEVLSFLERHRFTLVLSYDGLAQDAQRSPGSGARLRPLIRRILAGGRIRLETNSVFRPDSVGELSASMRGLIEIGVPSICFNLDLMVPWPPETVGVFGRELADLRMSLATGFRRTGRLPVRSMAELLTPALRRCPAAKDRLAVDPRGRIWGCAIFSDWARDYGGAAAVRDFSFGRVGPKDPAFGAKASRVGSRYREFAIEKNESPAGSCRRCSERGRCWVCPAVSALAGGGFHRIPAFVCDLQRIKAREAALLARAVGSV